MRSTGISLTTDPDAERNEDEVVEIADDRNEIGNEVDGAKSIGGYKACHQTFAYQGVRGSRAARNRARASRLMFFAQFFEPGKHRL